ncbi:MAG: hypothetical protein ABR615_10655 [Pseudonocardiaceae bacterium]
MHVPKPVADAPRGLITGVLLLAAVGLLIAALSTGHVGLAWGSVALSAVAAAMILRRWRRSWLKRQDAPEDESDLLVEDESDAAALAGQRLEPRPVAAVQDGDPGSAFAVSTAQPGDSQVGDDPVGDRLVGNAESGDAAPGEEETDAADLLVVYELTDDVLVVDEHPRYHLTRCRWTDQAHAERLPVREARELGFTPCDRCRPDTTLARKHRGARAASTGNG